MSRPLRIALVSSPRTGNHWLRHMLGAVYGIPEIPKHIMCAEDWASLPSECILQIHWPHERDFVTALRDHGFRTVTIARHPFDVLISILHIAVYGIQSQEWLQGRGGDEQSILGAMPRSRAFLNYAAGPRAAALLSVTCDWWKQDDCISVRYEDCVADPQSEMARLINEFGQPRRTSIAEAIEQSSIARMRQTSVNNQYWKGQPGLWRTLLPAIEAYELGNALNKVLEHLDYRCDPDSTLDAGVADANWVRCFGEELQITLRNQADGFQAEANAMQARFDAASAEIEAFYEAELQRHRERLAQFEGLTTGFPVRIARALQRVLDRNPRLTRAMRRVFRR